ncbi:hypothetical protein Tco_0520984 [Tanacetum coccineum]
MLKAYDWQSSTAKKFMGTVHFRNDHFTAITGYGDYVQGNLTICHVYYVKGLGHNLFLVGQFCDGDLEVQRIENKAKTVRGTVAIRGCWIEASGRLTCHHMIGGSSCY